MNVGAPPMRTLLQLICICGLLFAQHGALTHQIWHLHDALPELASSHAHEHEHEHEHGDEEDGQTVLCSFHLALCTVLGVTSGGDIGYVDVTAQSEVTIHPATIAAHLRPLKARSRGPPQFS